MAKVFTRPGSNKWQAECYFWDGTGRRRFCKSTGIINDGTAKSRQTAEIAAAAIERDIAVRGADAARPGKTIKQAFGALVEIQELAQRSSHTLEYTMDRATHFAEFFGPDKQLRELDDEALRAYARWARTLRSAYTVGREFELLARAFRVAKLPLPTIPDLGDKSNKPQRVLEVDEQRAVLLAVPPKRKTTIRSYLQLGLRLSEPWKITEVDRARRYVFVNGTKTKGSKRWVPVPDELWELLPSAQPLFPHWGLPDVDGLLKKIGRRTGIAEHLSVNDLRGTYATMQARAGVPLLTLAKIMGNSAKMLEKIYAQVQARGDHHDEVRRAVPRLGAAAAVRQNQVRSERMQQASGAPNPANTDDSREND